MEEARILRELPSCNIELSYFLCNQMLLNYSEEKQLFDCCSGEERIRLANSFCRVFALVVIYSSLKQSFGVNAGRNSISFSLPND